MIKLVALDLDGTLLNSEKNISERNKEAIRQAKAKGVKIVLCTGRPLGGISRYLEELNLLEEGDYAITFNGGLVQKNDTAEVLSQKTLSYEEIKELYHLSRSLGLPMNMLDLKYVYEPAYPKGRSSLYPSLMSANLPFINKEIEDFHPGHQFNKVVYCTDPVFLDEAVARIPADFKNRYSMMKSRSLLFEIMHPDVDKGKGIAELCRLLGISSQEVMACGDEENDLAMLRYAGTGVAMSNASERVKEEAGYITTSNDEDGVAAVIEKFILSK